MQNQDTVQRTDEHVVDLVIFGRCREHHAHEVARVIQILAWIDERLSDGIFVRHRHQRRHFRQKAHGRQLTMCRIGNVERIVIKGRQGADSRDQNGHRVGIATETAEEELHLFVHH